MELMLVGKEESIIKAVKEIFGDKFQQKSKMQPTNINREMYDEGFKEGKGYKGKKSIG